MIYNDSKYMYIYVQITIPHGNALDHLLHARRLATNLVRCPGWDFDGAGACDFVGVVVIYKLSSFVFLFHFEEA